MLNKKEATIADEQKIAITELMAKAKKRGMVTYREIMDSLQDVELLPEQIDEIYDSFSAMGVDVIPHSGEDGSEDGDLSVDDDGVVGDGAADDEVEDSDEGSEYDLSVPEGVGLDDPVRMYLKEIDAFRC